MRGGDLCHGMSASGNSFANGPTDKLSWRNGYQAPEPVNLYRLTEGLPDAWGLWL